MNQFATALSAALLAAVATAAGLHLLGPTAVPDATATTRGTVSRPSASEPASGETGELARRLDELALRLSGFEARLSELSAAEERRPVALDKATETVPDELLAKLASGPEPGREIILEVINQYEQEQEAAEAQRRQQELEDRTLARADRIATALGLATRDRDTLYGVLLEESTRRTAVFDTMRTTGFDPNARETIRTEMEAVRDWKSESLASHFGTEIAGRIGELDDRGGFRRGGPDGGETGGRRGGGGGGGGGRRGGN